MIRASSLTQPPVHSSGGIGDYLRNRPGLIRMLLLVLALVLWEVAYWLALRGNRAAFPPSMLLVTIGELVSDGRLIRSSLSTLTNVAIAFAMASIAGFALGSLLQRSRQVRGFVDAFLASYYSIPLLVFYPLLVGVLGINRWPLVALGVAFATPAMVINTLYALDRIPTGFYKVARTLRIGTFSTITEVVLPAALPTLLAGLRLTLGYAFVAVLGGEFLLSASGLGHSIAFAYENFDNRDMFALIIVVFVLAIALNSLLLMFEGKGTSASSKVVALTEHGSTLWTAIYFVLFLSLCVAVWQLIYETVGDVALASPAATMAFSFELLTRAFFWSNVTATMWAFGVSLVITISIGILVGLALGVSPLAAKVVEPMVTAFYSMPKITLYPIVLLLFGLGVAAKVAMGVLHGVLPVILYTAMAVRTVAPAHLKAARMMGLTSQQTAVTVIFPSCLPEVFAGVRIGFALTFLGVLIGEMFASQRGLGFMVMNAIEINDTATLTSVTMLVTVFAIVSNGVLLWVQRRIRGY